MRITEFFTGTEEEKKAKKMIDDFKENKRRYKKLGRRKQIGLDKARAISRRHFLRLALAGSASIIFSGSVIGILASKLSEKEKPKIPEDRPPAKLGSEEKPEFLSEQEIRSLYDEGFELIMKDVSSQPEKQNGTLYYYSPLTLIKNFKNKFVSWAKIEDNRYTALEDGREGGGWLAVIPSNHRLMKDQETTLEIDNIPDINALKIKPIPITKEWAGIILTHELSHLFDYVYNVEQKGSRGDELFLGEVRAYGSEILAVDNFTKGRFKKALSDIVRTFKFKSVDDAFSFVSNCFPGRKNECSDRIMDQLDPIVTNVPPRSDGERNLRNGFYMIAICYQTIESLNISNDKKKRAYINTTRKIHEN